MQYPKAPIIEAIFDIQLTAEHEPSHEVFEEAYKNIKSEFPFIQTTYLFSGNIQVDPKSSDVKTNTSTSIPVGKMFSNKEKNKHIQMKSNGYTFNMQAPYTNWEDFATQALKYFDFYKSYVSIKSIDRIAVRYINQINIPLPLQDQSLNVYMTCVPNVPNGLPKELHSYFNQVQIPYQAQNTILSITQTTLQQKDNVLPFLLDIDVYKIKDIANDSLRAEFDKLRTIKNTAFENSITDTTKALFKQN